MSEQDELNDEMKAGIQRSIDAGVFKCVEKGMSRELAEKFCAMFVIRQVNATAQANFDPAPPRL